MSIDIKGLDKGAVVAALHNGTRAAGMGLMADIGRELTVEEGRQAWEQMQQYASSDGSVRFDYLLGRPIKVRITEDTVVEEDMYDRDAPGGDGACLRAIQRLREEQK